MSITVADCGMPELPEGQWWEVVRVEARSGWAESGGFPVHYGDAVPEHYAVRIMRTVEVPATVEVRERGWWLRPQHIPVPATTRDEIVAREVVGENRPAAAFSTLHTYVDYEQELTPELVLKYAKKLVKRLENERAEKVVADRKRSEREAQKAAAKVITDSLLGAYPPKTLPPVEKKKGKG
ncbi:hypothetical protein [Arthrobacter sp. 31Y]|uniref:hypothetical protein n=1 Tax=Arthrobacter sp. 31Y TaxID=1115632 RepID=UPI000466670C|nr:hypothetical protein [Arthrobacter sp. 31Y]